MDEHYRRAQNIATARAKNITTATAKNIAIRHIIVPQSTAYYHRAEHITTGHVILPHGTEYAVMTHDR